MQIIEDVKANIINDLPKGWSVIQFAQLDKDGIFTFLARDNRGELKLGRWEFEKGIIDIEIYR